MLYVVTSWLRREGGLVPTSCPISQMTSERLSDYARLEQAGLQLHSSWAGLAAQGGVAMGGCPGAGQGPAVSEWMLRGCEGSLSQGAPLLTQVWSRACPPAHDSVTLTLADTEPGG